MDAVNTETLGSNLALSDDEFDRIRHLVHSTLGINLTVAKRQLVFGRLRNYIREAGFSSFGEYVDHLESDKSGSAISDLSDRISTNYTFFNREKDHFEFFAGKVLPEMTEKLNMARDRDLRVWCAGCATGEEPYMLAILEMEHFGNEYKKWKAGLLATDISRRALEAADKGEYKKSQIELVPESLRKKYFRNIDDDTSEISDVLKREVTFRRFNLMSEKYPFKKKFHVIFCRNVMIYFDKQTRDRVLKHFYDALVEGGYLFIGHSESILGGQGGFHYVIPAVYRKD